MASTHFTFASDTRASVKTVRDTVTPISASAVSLETGLAGDASISATKIRMSLRKVSQRIDVIVQELAVLDGVCAELAREAL